MKLGPTGRTTVVIALLAAAACAHPGRHPETGPAETTTRGREVGIASYYARSFNGHPTASGVRYDGRAMTCAHRSYPFGTVLRVTDLDTGKSVVVKVIDRGPFIHGRILDLSWAAAHELGILERGVARVSIERVQE